MKIINKNQIAKLDAIFKNFSKVGDVGFEPVYNEETCPKCKGECSMEVNVFGDTQYVYCLECDGRGTIQSINKFVPVKTKIENINIVKDSEGYEVIYGDENNEIVYPTIEQCKKECEELSKDE